MTQITIVTPATMIRSADDRCRGSISVGRCPRTDDGKRHDLAAIRAGLDAHAGRFRVAERPLPGRTHVGVVARRPFGIDRREADCRGRPLRTSDPMAAGCRHLYSHPAAEVSTGTPAGSRGDPARRSAYRFEAMGIGDRDLWLHLRLQRPRAGPYQNNTAEGFPFATGS